jgi:hypothetical protein
VSSGGSLDEVEGWTAYDVPDVDQDDLAQWAAGLGDLGIDDADVATAVALVRDPLASEPERIQRTLVGLGSSLTESERAISDLEAIQRRPAVRPGVHYRWGPEPDVTYAKLAAEEYEEWKGRRAYRLKNAVLSAFGLDTLIGQPHFEEVIVPILVLAAPTVTGAKVVWKGTEASAANGGFELTLLGSGLGANRSISIESSRTETCEHGEARRVRLAVPVLAQPFGRRRDGQVEVARYRRELAKAGPGVPLRRFLVDSLQESQLSELAGAAAGEEDRSDDRNAVELTDSVAVSGKRTLSVGVNYKGVEAVLSGTLEGKQTYDVTSLLPGGECYRRYYPRDTFGVMWMRVAG